MGLFDRFRRSSRTEPEKSSGQSSRSSSGADKKKSGDQGSSLASDQELLSSIASLMGQGSSDGGSTSSSSTAPSQSAKPSADSSSSTEEDLLSAMAALLGQGASGDSEPEPEPEPKSEGGRYDFDAIVDLMQGQDSGTQDSGKQESGRAAESQPEPKPAPQQEPADELGQDLLSALAALMGQDADDEKPIETEPIIDVVPVEEAASAPAEKDEEEENPFSAIAALMGQGSSDDEEPPADEPEPKDDAGSGDDLLSSLAALMGQSMYAGDQPASESPATSVVNPALEKRFESLCAESKRFEDRGALASALAKYLEACSVCENDAALKGMAYHHAASLALHSIGNGIDAANYAREALECGDAFRAYAEKNAGESQPNAYCESLRIAALTATSYDEALEYADQGEELYGDDFGGLAAKLREFRADHPRFADFQRSESLTYYSRVSAEEDKGDYAPAMALLQTMLSHAEDEGYGLPHEEQMGILDDYGTISIMHLLGKARSSGLSQEDFAEELSFIVDGPLSQIADFLPACQAADKQKLDRIIQGIKMLPGVSQRASFDPFR